LIWSHGGDVASVEVYPVADAVLRSSLPAVVGVVLYPVLGLTQVLLHKTDDVRYAVGRAAGFLPEQLLRLGERSRNSMVRLNTYAWKISLSS